MTLPNTRRGSGGGLGYQPALDGLRGLAVAAVVAYHVDRSWVPGGYLGVDIFFVLSGFSITTLLLEEQRSNRTVDLRRFWARRARRLFPALGLVLVAVAVYGATWAPANTLASLRDDGLASVFYVANWRFIFSHQSYFEQFGPASPLRHLWSLAVEEQWYLIWPLLVFASGSGVVVRSRLWAGDPDTRTRAGVQALVATVLACISAMWMATLVTGHGDTTRAYFGTDSHAQPLLVGAALAFWLQFRPLDSLLRRVPVERVQAVGLVGAAVGLFLLAKAQDQARWMYHGGFLLDAAAWAAVTLACLNPVGGPLHRALAAKPLVQLGRISYGVYLWHWPIIVMFTSQRTGLSGLPLQLLWIALTLSASVVSWRLVEQPIRTGRWRSHRWWQPKVLVPAGAVGVSALFLIVTTGAAPAPSAALLAAGHGPNHSAKAITVAGGGADPTTGWTSAPSGAPSPTPAPASRPLRIDTLGDSVGFNMAWYAPPIDGATITTHAIVGCGVEPDPLVINGGPHPPETNCPTWLQTWSQAAAAKPDIAAIFLGGFEVYAPYVDGRPLEVGTAEWERYLTNQLKLGITVLTEHTTTRVVLATVPCFVYQTQVYGEGDTERNDPARVAAVNKVFRSVVTLFPGRVALLDYAKFACPGGHFRATIDGVPLRPDGMHPDGASTPLVWKWLAPILFSLARRPSL